MRLLTALTLIAPCVRHGNWPIHSQGRQLTCMAGLARRQVSNILGPGRAQELELEQDSAGLQRLKFRRQGWSYWKWDGHDIHYVRAGAHGRAQRMLRERRLLRVDERCLLRLGILQASAPKVQKPV
jgi:hypothetical protein